MARRLSLQAPVVFEPSAPAFLRRLAFLAVIAPGFYFGYLATTAFTGIALILVLTLIAVLTIGLCLVAFDGIEGKVIVDADSIEWRSPMKKVRLIWNDGLQLRIMQSTFARGASFRTYSVVSGDTKLAFGENLQNQEYLLRLIDAGINGVADKNSVVHVPLPPPDSGNQKMVESFMLVSLLAVIGALVMGALAYYDVKKLYFMPAPRISEVATYAGKDTLVRVKGRIHLEPPLLSRDGKHSFSFQYIRLKNANGDASSIINPPEFNLIDDTKTLTVKAVHEWPDDFAAPLAMKLQKNWQKTSVGNFLPDNLDETFKEYEKQLPALDMDLMVWNVPQDQPVEVVGRIKSENGSLLLQAVEEPGLWLSKSVSKQIEPWLLVKAIIAAVLLAFSAYLFVVASAEAKKITVQ